MIVAEWLNDGERPCDVGGINTMDVIRIARSSRGGKCHYLYTKRGVWVSLC